jgi:hypothetical protein
MPAGSTPASPWFWDFVAVIGVEPLLLDISFISAF